MLQQNLAATEDLGNGIFYESLFNNHIISFVITSVSRLAIDTWTETQARVMKEWPTNRPLCILDDQSFVENVTFTPYMKSRFSDLADASVDKSGRVAVVVGKGFFMQLARTLFQGWNIGDMELRFFLDRNEALSWLQEIL